MKKSLALFVSFYCVIAALAQGQTRLQSGMVIRTSVTIKKEKVKLAAPAANNAAVIVIEGKNITVDFNGVELSSPLDPTRPDEFTGLAILIKKGSSNITLKNAIVRGYKIGVLADGVTNLVIESCDFSYNYRQRLKSNLYREDISDWMSYHHNDADEWMRYGAGIYVKDCNNMVIAGNTITNGQCGLMMTRCTNAEVADNNFSFNSGIGIGLYRSSYNRFYHNRLDFNVRGFSFGYYYRGQDSAGFLVFEQSSNNVFAYNTATHSGDGFFLWAGQYTMDTGGGGCNDNLLYGNDFSYAPTNGVEVTFSRNTIDNNIIHDCDHGIWGGYSYNTIILRNNFSGNRIAIAIEHGQNNTILQNRFSGDKTAIKLWSRKSQPANWAYAQKRDTRSTGYAITDNSFIGHNTVFDLLGSDSLIISGNEYSGNGAHYKLGERMAYLDSTARLSKALDTSATNRILESLPYNTLPYSRYPRGREQMRINDWGPYNFAYPVIWLKKTDSTGLYTFEILGPEGSWSTAFTSGFTLIGKVAGTIPATVLAKVDSSVQDRFIRLKYSGNSYTDMFGIEHTAGDNDMFQYKEFDPGATWNIALYTWDSTNHPVRNAATFFQQLTTPFYTATAAKIDYTWWGSIVKNMPADSFATVATATLNLPEADYSIGLTADDLARLYIDGKPVIDVWDTKYVALDENTHHRITMHLGGKHEFRIEHADISGLASLMLYLQPLSTKK